MFIYPLHGHALWRKGLVAGGGHISLTHPSEGTDPMATSASTGLRAAAGRTAEASRLEEIHRGVHWRRWGPYLSERQWGTVREDYSEHGDAWEYFPHDHARSRAYRWGEDGIGGFGDNHLLLCLGLALWNGRDPILKERLFGLTNGEGNHGEDVKELYYYLDGTPTHSYMRMLYKYPQAAFPYDWLVEENQRRGRNHAVRQPDPADAGGHTGFVIYGDNADQCRARRGRRLRCPHQCRPLCQGADHSLHQRQQRLPKSAIHHVRRSGRWRERTHD